MRFDWTAEDVRIHEHFREAGRTLLGASHGVTPESPVRRQDWERLGNCGMLGLCVPKDFGGWSLNALQTAHAIEGFALTCLNNGITFSACAHLLACVRPVLDHGNESLRVEVLSELAAGKRVGANAITETEAGSDVFAMGSMAERREDGYVLCGEKSFVTNGPDADEILVYAKTNPKLGDLGVSAFLVPGSAAGLSRSEDLRRAGLHGARACAIRFAEVYVPSYRRLGQEGDGARIFRESMAWERSCLFALYLGTMERTLTACLSFARSRKQFRKAIGRNQSISSVIVDMKGRLEASRLMLYQACWRKDCGHDALLDISLAKLMIADSALQTSLEAVQIFGSRGYLVESGLEQLVRDTLPAKMFSGTSEIMHDVAAAELGL